MVTVEIPAGLRLPRTAVCPESHHLARERSARLRAAVARLPARCGALVAALLEDPTADYATLAAHLGSIGPTRSRCIECLRRRLGPDL
ncbi:hypothetical protein [Streptacidiphilus neutrinimicus]|uniref:hypothetical protein n=1 Tax=Streptacidiphilus neutrinimicus TaxID=105420 RepID=UPI0005A76F25|nr:hypothetical protein [Streptacidiphilus neutrinimicus]